MIEKYRTAILQRDIATLDKIWADDYVFVNAAGDVLAKTERLANINSGATTLDSINEEENVTVRVYQNSAVATSRVTLKGQYSGQPISGGISKHSGLGKRLRRLAIGLESINSS